MHCILNKVEIHECVKDLGLRIRTDYIRDLPTVVPIANGSLFFFVDLIREIGLDLSIETIKARSYEGSLSEPIQINVAALNDSLVKGKNILLVDDILETGTTVDAVTELLMKRGAANVDLCVLLFKEGKLQYQIVPKYVGFVIDDVWVVGYGMDLNNKWRCQSYIGVPAEKMPKGPKPRRGRRWLGDISEAS
jgi:hypoxanthine phosphoribosyltransferase